MNRDQAAGEQKKLDALREAARTGIADIEAGRFMAFDSVEALDRHLSALADEIFGAKGMPANSRSKP